MKRLVVPLMLVSTVAFSAERVSEFAIINGNKDKNVVVRYDPSISLARNNDRLLSPAVGRPLRSSLLASFLIKPNTKDRLQLLSTKEFWVTLEIDGFEPLKNFRISELRDPLIIMPECDNSIQIIQGSTRSAIMIKNSSSPVVQPPVLKKEDIDEYCCCVQ